MTAQAADGFVHLNPDTLFNAHELFTQAIIAPRGRTLYVSGLLGTMRDAQLIPGGKAEQIAQTFRNMRAAFEAAGCPPSCCVRVTEYVVDYNRSDLVQLKAELRMLFDCDRLPTNTLVPVPSLARDGALFEMDAVAVLPD